ncbi:ABC transporter ATP-binding protein [Devosia oryzisoli]|nr:oligopeptide/dipeptide ABC transporter ATP-binding protein [Devosia oryzisoli]
MEHPPLISVEGLSKRFPTRAGDVHALEDVNFSIPRGSIVGLVGESGSGKTTLGRCILRLVEPSEGRVMFDGQNILDLPPKELRALRRRMQIIFQDPFSSLNPRMRVRTIIEEGLIAHRLGGTSRERRDRVATLLEEVGLQADHMTRFAHEFSGGQRQRVGIARALAIEPEFIVADESVSALDVSVQAQILNLLLDLCEARNLTMLFIAHDLSVVEYLCDQVVVMYLGHVVENGSTALVHSQPAHPYTTALLSAAPVPDPFAGRDRNILKGEIPSPLSPPSGCVFHTRCPLMVEHCRQAVPELRAVGGRRVACHRAEDVLAMGPATGAAATL